MVFINENENNILSKGIRDIYDLVKNILSIISKNNKNVTIINQKEIIHEKAQSILNNLTEIFLILDDNPEFENEFICCGDIKRMANYIFKDDELIIKYTPFITDIIINFCNLLDDKLEYLSSQNAFDYNREFEKFDDYLYDQKDIFYLEIMDDDLDTKHDELISEIGKLTLNKQ